MIVLRATVDHGLFNLPPNRKAPPGRSFVEYLSIFRGVHPRQLDIRSACTEPVQARGKLREIIGGPGFVACAAVALASVLPVAYFAIGMMCDTGLGSLQVTLYFNNLFWRLTHGAGRMISGAWIALALSGRWRPGPLWTDRLGCVLGISWICIYVYCELYS